jgi:hypothetical protein
MPKAIAPSVAQINIAKFNKSAIQTASSRFGKGRNRLRQRALRGPGNPSISFACAFAIVAEVGPH